MFHAEKVKKYVIDHKIEYAQDEIIALYELGKEKIKTEQKITYLKLEIELLQFYGNVEHAVKNMCDCAYLFAGAGEYQSAYRILNDANKYAVNNKNFTAIIMTLEVQGEVCIHEGDYDTALIDMGNAKKLLMEMDMEIPKRLTANLALVKYRKGKYDEAEKDYADILASCDEEDTEWWSFKLNKVLCKYRECENIETIASDLNELGEKYELATKNAKIEYHLISAEIFLQQDEEKAISHLFYGVVQIEQVVNENIRLHYRRGVREKYVNRIKGIICRIKKTCRKDIKLLTILVFLKVNMMVEWLAIKEFIKCTEIMDKKEKEDAINIVKRMEREGIPVLFGYSEKYDDPFEEYGLLKDCDSVNKMWNDLAGLLSRNNISVETLYKNASCMVISEYILKDTSGLYIFVESCAEGMNVWYNNGNMEDNVLWENKHLVEYFTKHFLFQRKEVSRREFKEQIEVSATTLISVC